MTNKTQTDREIMKIARAAFRDFDTEESLASLCCKHLESEVTKDILFEKLGDYRSDHDYYWGNDYLEKASPCLLFPNLHPEVRKKYGGIMIRAYLDNMFRAGGHKHPHKHNPLPLLMMYENIRRDLKKPVEEDVLTTLFYWLMHNSCIQATNKHLLCSQYPGGPIAYCGKKFPDPKKFVKPFDGREVKTVIRNMTDIAKRKAKRAEAYSQQMSCVDSQMNEKEGWTPYNCSGGRYYDGGHYKDHFMILKPEIRREKDKLLERIADDLNPCLIPVSTAWNNEENEWDKDREFRFDFFTEYAGKRPRKYYR